LQHHRRVALGQQVAGAREPVVFLPVNTEITSSTVSSASLIMLSFRSGSVDVHHTAATRRIQLRSRRIGFEAA